MSTTANPRQPAQPVTRYGVPLGASAEQKLLAAIASTGRTPRHAPSGGFEVFDLKTVHHVPDLAALQALADTWGLRPFDTATPPAHAFGEQQS